MRTYLVSIGEKEYEVRFDVDGVASLTGISEQIDVRPVCNDAYAVLIGNRSTQILARKELGEYHVLLQNNQVSVKVETYRDRLLKKYSTTSGTAHHRYEIHAPMPALVVRVEVNAGDEVREGQGLIVLEAMKMENEIRSPQAGKVREVYVSKGKAVEKGELLLLLE